MSILLVDDNEPFRDATAMALRSRGYVVETCSSPAAALESVARSRPFQLLITDVVMATMNGATLAARVRLLRPEVKVLFCSGLPEAALVRNDLDLGQGEFLMKPMSIDALSSKIDELLNLMPHPGAS